MIEIGRESALTRATLRVAEAMGGMAAIIVVIWLIRRPLGIESYSLYLLLGSVAFVYLGRLFRTRASLGSGRALTSLLGNLTAASVITIIMVWFLGWIAGLQNWDPFPAQLSNAVPELVIAAVATGLAAYAAHKIAPGTRRAVAAQPVFVIREGKGVSMHDAKLAVKKDTAAVSIKQSGKSVGCVILGDLTASFETPMGTVGAKLTGPVTTAGLPFSGSKAGDDESVRMTGKTPKQLVDEARVDAVTGAAFGRFESIDLPFIHVQEDGFEDVVEVGPIKVREGLGGSHVKLGPISFDTDDVHSWRSRWIAKGVGDTYIRRDGHDVTAKWNGSTLSINGGSMKLAVGSDSFSYSPAEVKTASPLHTLQVTQDKITLETHKFTLKVSGDTVMLRSADKTTSTESKALAGDLRALLTEAAKKQVKDVLEGLPIDLSEMLSSTEEVLARHG